MCVYFIMNISVSYFSKSVMLDGCSFAVLWYFIYTVCLSHVCQLSCIFLISWYCWSVSNCSFRANKTFCSAVPVDFHNYGNTLVSHCIRRCFIRTVDDKVCDGILNNFLSAMKLSPPPSATKLESKMQETTVIREGMEGWWHYRDFMLSFMCSVHPARYPYMGPVHIVSVVKNLLFVAFKFICSFALPSVCARIVFYGLVVGLWQL